MSLFLFIALRDALNFFSFLLSFSISTFVFILNFAFHLDFFVTSKSKWAAKFPYMVGHDTARNLSQGGR